MSAFTKTLVSKQRFTRADAAWLPPKHTLVLVPAPGGWMGDYDAPTSESLVYGLIQLEGNWLLLKQVNSSALKTFKSISAGYRYFTEYPDKHDTYRGKIELANIQDIDKHYAYLNIIGKMAGFAKQPPPAKLKKSDLLKGPSQLSFAP